MARIRNIKPEFFTSESVSALPLRARLTWVGLWTHCDNHGRTRDNLRLIKAAVWPLDNVSLKDIEEDLTTLADHGRIVRYQVDGKRYLMVTNWGEHQYAAFKGPAKYPPPPVDNPPDPGRIAVPPADPPTKDDLLDESRPGPHSSRRIQVSGVRDQGGGTREAHTPRPPPPRCPQHHDEPAPGPCAPCGDYRRAREHWDAEQPRRDATRRSAEARRAAELRAIAAMQCDMCDDNGRLPGGLVCDHDPARPERAARGRAAVQAALTRKDTA